MVFSNKYTCVSSFRIAAALCKMVLRRTPDSWERREVSKVLLEKEKLPAMGASADHAVIDLTKQVRLAGPARRFGLGAHSRSESVLQGLLLSRCASSLPVPRAGAGLSPCVSRRKSSRSKPSRSTRQPALQLSLFSWGVGRSQTVQSLSLTMF